MLTLPVTEMLGQHFLVDLSLARLLKLCCSLM